MCFYFFFIFNDDAGDANYITLNKKGNVIISHGIGIEEETAIAPPILNLDTGWRCAVNFTSPQLCHQEKNPVPTKQKVWCALESVQTFWESVGSKFLHIE